MVRLQSDNYITSKFFNVNKLGLRGAKSAAIEWRDKQLLSHEPQNALNVPEKRYYRADRCTNPIIGVTLSQCRNGYFGWVARYMIDGKQKLKHYSVNLYGFDAAFDWACKARYENKGVLIVTNTDLLPHKPKYPHEIKEHEPTR